MGKTKKGETMAYIGNVVSTVRVYASALTWINFLLVSALVLMSLVPGAALGGPSVDYSSMPHLVWLIPNFLVLAFILYTVADTSYINMTEMTNTLTAAFVFAIISAIINGLHASMLIVECAYQSSTFYLQGFPFLVVFTVGVIVFFVWQLWIAARLWVYRSTITNASAKGWNIGVELQQAAMNKNGYMSIPAYREPESDATTTTTIPAPPSAPLQEVKASIATPLLLPGLSSKRAFGRKTE